MAKEKRLREKDVTIRWGDLSFSGSSRAGYRTHVAVKELDLVFDLGSCSMRDSARNHILLSHVHMDHALGVLRSIALREMTNQKAPKVYLPAESCQAFRDALRAWDRLENRQRDKEGLFIPVKAGDQFSIGRGVDVHVFNVRHTVSSIGFHLTRKKMKLKAEFKHLSGSEIGDLVRSGVQVKEGTTENLMTYIGDAHIETLHDYPELLKSKVLILECTYLSENDTALSKPRGHIHIDEIARYAGDFECELLILKHFSLKYSLQEIETLVEQRMPAELYKRTALLL
jgi:ribonuclease Z